MDLLRAGFLSGCASCKEVLGPCWAECCNCDSHCWVFALNSELASGMLCALALCCADAVKAMPLLMTMNFRRFNVSDRSPQIGDIITYGIEDVSPRFMVVSVPIRYDRPIQMDIERSDDLLIKQLFFKVFEFNTGIVQAHYIQINHRQYYLLSEI